MGDQRSHTVVIIKHRSERVDGVEDREREAHCVPEGLLPEHQVRHRRQQSALPQLSDIHTISTIQVDARDMGAEKNEARGKHCC